MFTGLRYSSYALVRSGLNLIGDARSVKTLKYLLRIRELLLVRRVDIEQSAYMQSGFGVIHPDTGA